MTSLGGHDVDLAGWGVDIAYSCTQKCIGAPSGLAPIAVSGPARERLVPCRSFYLDLKLLEDYWVGRKYHHTMSASLLYALREALAAVEEEGLQSRWSRHEQNHLAFVKKLEVVAYEDLGTEAIRRLEVAGFPAIVVNDCHGGDLYEDGIKTYAREEEA